ncbi:MAG: AEC family transporter [Clostridiales bacterium]|nr:AEC family transporter [Clostridiales bacterium]
MLDIILRAGSFIAIIVLGYLLKRIGVFKQEDFGVLSKIAIRITLPCAIIVSFSGKVIDPSLLSLPLISIACGAVYVTAGYLFHRNKTREQQAFGMLNLAGYNIGNFTIPFAQSFLGPMAVIAISIFDIGNAMVCLGGAFSLACMVKDGSRFSLTRVIRALMRSVPFVVYLIVLTMCMLHIPTPRLVLSVAEIGSSANAFAAMLMIGVGFKLEAKREQLMTIARIVAIRYTAATVFALIFYFVLPFALEIRQALVILAFAPVGAAVPGFTGEMGGDVGLSSAINSICMVISITLIVSLLLVML